MKDRISAMVDRFLGWKLPPTFGPDAGIKFTPSNGMNREEAYAKPGWWPIGTNLFTASEAREMLEHVSAVEVPELSLRELDAIGRAYFNGPLNSNEEMFGRAVERAVRCRLLGTAGVTGGYGDTKSTNTPMVPK